MAGNGDERMTAAWERVEAKLDRLGEEVRDQGRVLKLVADRLSELELRSAVPEHTGKDDTERRGDIWRALRASPLVDAGLDLERDRGPGRPVEL